MQLGSSMRNTLSVDFRRTFGRQIHRCCCRIFRNLKMIHFWALTFIPNMYHKWEILPPIGSIFLIDWEIIRKSEKHSANHGHTQWKTITVTGFFVNKQFWQSTKAECTNVILVLGMEFDHSENIINNENVLDVKILNTCFKFKHHFR